MSYLLELRQGDAKVAQEINDKDTLWIILEAMLDGESIDVECLVSKIHSITDEKVWDGKWESRHER